MPDAPASTGRKSNLGFLTRKVGPLPIWAYALIAVGVWYWYTHYGPGKPAAAGASATAVDPSTGVTYAEELAAANQEITDLQGTTLSSPEQEPAEPPEPGEPGEPGPGPLPSPCKPGWTFHGGPMPEIARPVDSDAPAPYRVTGGYCVYTGPVKEDHDKDDRRKPGKGKHPQPKPHTRHNRKPGSSGPGRNPLPPQPREAMPIPAHHPAAPKAPADKATAPMTRWRAA